MIQFLVGLNRRMHLDALQIVIRFAHLIATVARIALTVFSHPVAIGDGDNHCQITGIDGRQPNRSNAARSVILQLTSRTKHAPLSKIEKGRREPSVSYLSIRSSCSYMVDSLLKPCLEGIVQFFSGLQSKPFPTSLSSSQC